MNLNRLFSIFKFIRSFFKTRLSSKKKFTSKSIIFLIFSITVFFFQNCKINESLDLSALSILSKKQTSIEIQPVENVHQTASGGNGDGYEGKLNGRFVRWIPEHSCEGTEAEYSELILDSSNKTAQLITNESALCQARSDEIIDLNTIDFSSMNQNIVAYQDGIYLRAESTQQNVEASCQSEFVQMNIFLSNTVNLSSSLSLNLDETQKNLRVAEIFFKDPNSSKISKVISIPLIHADLQTSEKVSKGVEYKLDSLHYEKNSALESLLLSIDSQKMGLYGQHQFDSHLTIHSSIEALNQTNLIMSCRLAGHYDGVIWPSKVLVQGKQVHDFQLLKKNNLDLGFVFSADHIQSLDRLVGPKKLYYLNFQDGSTNTLVSDFPERTTGIQRFLITQDQENVIYSAIENPLGFTDLFRLSLDLKIKNKINSERTSSGYGVLPDFQLDPQTERIIFRESSTLPGIPQSMFYLRTNTMDGTSLQKVISETGDLNEQTRNYWIDSTLNKIFFYTGFTTVQLNMFDPQTNQLTKSIDNSIFEHSQQVMNWYDILNASEISHQTIHPKYLLSVLRDGITSTSKRLLRSNFDGTQSVDLGYFENVKSYSPDGTKIILEIKTAQELQFKFIDLDNLTSFAVPSGDSYLFNATQDGVYIWKHRTENNIDFFLDLQFFHLTTKTFSTLKSIPSKQKIVHQFQWMYKNQYLVFMMDSNLDKLNELYLLDIFDSSKDLIQISDRYFDYGGVKEFKIINDRSIVYSTQPLNNISPSLFIWSLPEAK